jgi:peptide-methionine (R)-S-oxide reductase
MRLVLEALKEKVTRRRALLITPFAFAGLVAISSRKGIDSEDSVSANDSDSEVVIVPFTDIGERLAPVTVKKLIRSDAQWRKLLDAEQYYITRRQGTDTAFTGTYYQLHDPGLFRCICCGNALFSSDAKFDSGTGWPSFSAAVADENIHTHKDVSLFIERVEVACTRCDAHLGHVFTDGPEPTYLRYCINESSVNFVRHSGSPSRWFREPTP